MAVTLDTLELRIQSNSAGASSGIKSLTDSLVRLSGVTKTSLGRLKELADALGSIASSVKSVTGTSGLATAVSKIERATGVAKVKAVKPLTDYDREHLGNRNYKPSYTSPGKGSGEITFFDSATGKFQPMSYFMNPARELANVQRYNPIPSHGQSTGSAIQSMSGRQFFDLYNSRMGFGQEIKDASESAKVFLADMEKSKGIVGYLKDGFANIRDSMHKGFKNSIFGQFMRVAKMRALRAIVKQIAMGFKEGVTNLYQWSKLNQGHFAESMDTAQTKLLLLKNSLATAFAPALEALVPVLSTVVGWVRSACNAFSQLFALLSGRSSWTMATEHVQEFSEAVGGQGGGAGKAVKDLLADWDELNVIQSQSGGGGGGGSGFTAEDYKDMFQEVYTFDENLKKHFNDILWIVGAIGATILTWKLANGLEKGLAMFGVASENATKLKTTLWKIGLGGILLTLGAKLGFDFGSSLATGKVDTVDILKGIAGGVSSAIGGAVIASALGVSMAVGAGAGLLLYVGATIAGFIWERNNQIENEAREWIEQNVTNFKDIEAKIELAKATIEKTDVAEQNLKSQAEVLFGTFNTLTFGMDETKTYEQLAGQLPGFLSSVDTLIAEKQNLMKVSLDLVPVLGEDGKNNSADILASADKGWAKVDKFYEDTGKRLGELLAKGRDKALKDGEPELIKELMEQMQRVTSSMTNAKIRSEAQFNLEETLFGIKDSEIASKVGQIFGDYEDELRKQFTAIRREAIVAQEQLTEALFEIDPNGTEYREARAKLEELKKNWASDVEYSVGKESASGKSAVLAYMLSKFTGLTNNKNWLPYIRGGAYANSTHKSSGFLGLGVETLDAETASQNLRSELATWIMNELGADKANAFSKFGNIEDYIADFLPSDFKQELAETIIKDFGDSADIVLKSLGIENVSIQEKQETWMDRFTRYLEILKETPQDDNAYANVNTDGKQITTEETAKTGFANVENRMTQLENVVGNAVTYLQRLTQKRWTVQVNPTSAWGLFGATAGAMSDKVTGEG